MKEKIKNVWKKIWKPVTIVAGGLVVAIAGVAIYANTAFIGADSAKEIAAGYAGVSGDVRYTKAKLDIGDRTYDVEFISNGVKYEMEIDARNGQVRDFDTDGTLPVSNGQSGTDANTNNNNTTDNTTGQTTVTEVQARETALQHAGVAEADATFLRCELDWDDGRQVYDVEFYVGNTEYDYEIDAASGDIISYDYDAEYGSVNNGQGAGGNTGSNTNTGSTGGSTGSGTSTTITEAEAREIALQHAGISASDATFVRSHLDWDDGRQVYDVEFYVGNTEYDYEIDAASGDIISYDYDAEWHHGQSSGSSGSSSASISAQEAQNIALGHAGVNSGDTYGLKCELDRDDGRLRYEVEFMSAGYEYSYEIDANSGDILQYDRERD